MLIKCNECGREISDKAEVCPYCGTPLVVPGDPVDETTQIADQPNQGTNQSSQWANHPQGYGPQPYQQQPYYQPVPPQGSNNGLLYLIIGLLAAGLIGLGLYVFLGQQKEETGKEVVKTETKAKPEEQAAPQVEKVIVAMPEKKTTNYPQGHYALDGGISKYGCHIDIDLSGSDATGSYYYTKNGSNNRLYLTGNVDGQHVELYEFNDDGDQTGYFDGTFDGVTYQGTFINYKGQAMAFRFLAE